MVGFLFAATIGLQQPPTLGRSLLTGGV